MLRTATSEEKKELAKRVEHLSEHIKYAPESDNSDDCRICDGEMEQTITEISRLIQDNTFTDKDEDFISRMQTRLLSLQQTLDQRKFIITHKI